MARRVRLPDALTRRHLLERTLGKAQAQRIAEGYLAQDRVAEAVAFLRKAEDDERLQSLREQATVEGDAFLLRQVAAAQGKPPEVEEWRAVAEAAQARGKLRYAADAERQLGRQGA